MQTNPSPAVLCQVLRPHGGRGGRLRAAPPGARVAAPLRCSLRERVGNNGSISDLMKCELYFVIMSLRCKRVAAPLRCCLVRDWGGLVMTGGWRLCPGCVLVQSPRGLFAQCSAMRSAVSFGMGPPWVVAPPVLCFAHCASLCCFPAPRSVALACSNARAPSWPSWSRCHVSAGRVSISHIPNLEGSKRE